MDGRRPESTFGKRVPPATASRPDPAAPKSKRSQAVSLVLIVGAGAAALALGRIDPSQREEDVLVYPSAEACALAAIRTEADCRTAYDAARAAYAGAAPRYGTNEACEAHHGPGRCRGAETLGEGERDNFVPLMAAYVVGRTAEQALPTQPLFDHSPQDANAAPSSVGYGGYCTGAGGRIRTGSGGRSASARVASSTVRGTTYGGFGGTGRAFASQAAHSGGG